mgnify:FL=1
MKRVLILIANLVFIFVLTGCKKHEIQNITVHSEITSVSDSGFDISYLVKHKNIAMKTMTATDSMQNKNKQIMGTKGLDKTLGTKTVDYQVNYIYVGNKIVTDTGKIKWGYICPPSWHGRCKGQITYKDNNVMRTAKAGDLIIIAKKTNTDILFLIIQKDSKQEKQFYSALNNQQASIPRNHDLKYVDNVAFIEKVPDKAWVQVYFTPGLDCENNIIQRINDSSKIDIAVYGITNRNIVNSIISAQKRGATVRIITDRLQSSGKHSLVGELKNAGLDVRTNSGTKHKIEHNKIAIFDNKEIVTGSYNWTKNASSSNSENCIFINDAKTKNAYLKQFNYLWDFYSGQ